MANFLFSWDEDELNEAASDAALFRPEQLQEMAFRYLRALIFQHESIEVYYLVSMMANDNAEDIGIYSSYVEDRQVLAYLYATLVSIECNFEPGSQEVIDCALEAAASQRGKHKHQMNVNHLEAVFRKSQSNTDLDPDGQS